MHLGGVCSSVPIFGVMSLSIITLFVLICRCFWSIAVCTCFMLIFTVSEVVATGEVSLLVGLVSVLKYGLFHVSWWSWL